MIYEIIDTRTGERASAQELAQEPWAEKTRGCDWPAFAIDEDGNAILADDCGNYDMVPEGRVEVRLVVDREKWKPCEYCGEGRKALAFDSAGDSVSIEIGMVHAAIESDSWGFLVSYCPRCGLPLTDAVWAELEKKIRGCVE